ncbi:uncharacterized protein LOC118438040 [Folsomia candida]|uniref:E3 ubiquitin-protein ligase mib1 n=1 Tax=Folsomia candida TaxID=158441 RepID=A0A226DHY9_FOLCA|nr:uncharacterized protein LOC118438040 [Folsomia candida]OXA45162.1 E3 ubiquitin-protein ligase mib1 [Folsomia candida]
MATYNGNTTTLQIPPKTKIRTINVNSGDIIVGAGCSIEYCNYNEGSITFLGACKISDMEANKGTITVGAGSSIASCYRNSGIINTENNVKIVHMKANKAVISIGTGSKISEIANNKGTIFISNECEIEAVHFNEKVIAFGESCSIGKIFFNQGTISLANGVHGFETNGNAGFIVGRGLAYAKDDRKIPFEVEPPSSEASFYAGKGLVAFAEQYNEDIRKFIVIMFPTNDYAELDRKARRLRQEATRENYNLSFQSSGTEFSPDRQTPTSSTNENVPEASSPVKEVDPLCPICMVHRKNMAFQCGHLCCTRCSVGLSNCPICRKAITQRIQIYL